MIAVEAVLQYGRRKLPYKIRFARRKTMGIAVHPDMQVTVTAPQDTPVSEIERQVSNRARWIVGKVDYFSQYQPRTPPRRYVGGETHRYLGRSYILKVARGAPSSVTLTGRNIVVTLNGDRSSRRIRSALLGWYRAMGKERYEAIARKLATRFPELRGGVRRLAVREMGTRWGSLSDRGTLTLNRRLIEAPATCIEYVIAHELCHTLHPDHGKEFVRLLARLMPDWEQRKLRLEKSLL